MASLLDSCTGSWDRQYEERVGAAGEVDHTHAGLYASIIWRAWLDLHAPERHIFKDAANFFSEPFIEPPKASIPFSYQWLCETLDLEPYQILNLIERDDLLNWDNQDRVFHVVNKTGRDFHLGLTSRVFHGHKRGRMLRTTL